MGRSWGEVSTAGRSVSAGRGPLKVAGLVFVGGGILVDYCLATFALVLAIVKRNDDMRGFVVLPKRRIVERLLAHPMRSRRLARDFERRTTSARRWSTGR
jgi:hypothetical protein